MRQPRVNDKRIDELKGGIDRTRELEASEAKAELHAGLRPAWLLRLGLFLYDHLGGRALLPATRSVEMP